MTDEERTHGKCAHCKQHFPLTDRHIAYGGLLWCSIDHLAKWTVDHEDNPLRSSVREIEQGYEIRGAGE